MSSRLGREVGWRDYREIVLGPDYDFIAARRTSVPGHSVVPVLTVFKFPSSWRKNSYIEKPSHEQATYVRRIENERGFIYRELLSLQLAQLRHFEPPVDFLESDRPRNRPAGA